MSRASEKPFGERKIVHGRLLAAKALKVLVKKEVRSEPPPDGNGFGVRGLNSEARHRLNQAVDAAGGRRKIADLTGIPLSTLADALDGKSEPRFSLVAAVAEKAGRSLDFIVYGAGPDAPLVIVGKGAGPGFVGLPMLEISASAGLGLAAMPEQIGGGSVIAFREEFLRAIGVNPRRAEVLRAQGDSMEPTIRDGDLLVVDRAIDRLIDNGIYVLVYAGMVLLKRVQALRDGSVVLKSDNPQYAPEPVPPSEVHELRIEGRVRWFGRPI